MESGYGYVYRLFCGDLSYYGSSGDDNRIRGHKNKSNTCTSVMLYQLAEEKGIQVECEILEQYDEIVLADLKKKEDYYICNFDCVNKNRAYLSDEEKAVYFSEYMPKYYKDNKHQFEKYYQEKKEIIAQHYQENKENIAKYYKDNKEKILERERKYREKNKEKRTIWFKTFYAVNKERLKQKQKDYNAKKKLEKASVILI